MDEPARSPSPFSVTLRTKLVLSTAVILVAACLLLGWVFIRQQVHSAAESLVGSGTLLAQHLAGQGRFSIVAGDIHRLDQLIRETLSVNPVAYVAVVSSDGVLQAGLGRDEWQQQFSTPPGNQRQFSVTALVQPHRLNADTNAPHISGIWLANDRPVLRSTIEFTPGELLSLMGGSDLPVFYDLLVPVRHHARTSVLDPALQLTLEERLDAPDDSTALSPIPPSLVEVGLSTSNLQHLLRQLLWQALLITMSTLIGGLGLAILLARRMTVPLQGLTTAATKLANGETVPTVAIRAHDEIGTLTHVFNDMASRLQSREHELRDLAQTLEDRVEARTQALAIANAKLQELDHRKSVFVSTASHELRTPLTSMKFHLANLRDGIDGAITEEQRRSLLRAESNLSRLQFLIDDLLDLSYIEMGQATIQLESIPLEPVVTKTVDDLHPFTCERRVKIVTALPSDLPSVSADPEKLRQILLNLLHNAVKFSPADAVVHLTAMKLSTIEILVSVRDVGPGIAPGDVDKIFQPFYRAPTVHKTAKGAGLGLTIAKSLVELHHGRLWVETTPHRGSCFSFTLRSTPSHLVSAAPTGPRLSHDHTV
ncbi:MAG: HAMP domain-containing histidine kinase [Nitrospira sp.]|nr:HAMP domain-containing histidine kinase [Nitrospira sp.]MBH0180574.1 HAMP domain-containing histidine kinase [Nitrospira sp.]MBH0186801.1 HAMP domain-containing histidine kinase [Nitrospira sp.]